MKRWMWLPVAAVVGFLSWQNHVLAQQIAALSAKLDRGPAPSVAALGSCFASPSFARQIAEQLRATVGGGAREPAARSTEAPAREDEPVRAVAIDGADHLVAQAITRGRISRDDVMALRAQLADATVEQADKVRQRIAAAINRDELVPEDPNFIFP
jgi:hypothetical protein